MNDQWQEDFIHYLRFEKRCSPHTITAYRKDLDQFATFFSTQFGETGYDEAKLFHIRSWLAALKEKGLEARTLNRKISSLQAFFRFLLRRRYIRQNPARQIHAVRTPDRLPSYLRESEADNLFEEVSFGTGFGALTERMICTLLYQTGMRRSELVSLKEQDVEWSMKQIRVTGKGNKERLIPVSEGMLGSIREYISEKRKQDRFDAAYLLNLESGAPLYAGYVYRTVKKYLTLVTTLSKKSPHILRHSFATHLLSEGAGIQAIKDLLGHSSLAATQIYTHNHIEKLREVHKRTHPRG